MARRATDVGVVRPTGLLGIEFLLKIQIA